MQAWQSNIIPSTNKPTTDRLEARKLLHSLIHKYFDPGEIQSLCYDLGIIYGDLGEGGHDDKIRELLLLVFRLKRGEALRRRLAELRPNVAWPVVE